VALRGRYAHGLLGGRRWFRQRLIEVSSRWLDQDAAIGKDHRGDRRGCAPHRDGPRVPRRPTRRAPGSAVSVLGLDEALHRAQVE
jgi:hypothetical protein